MTTEIIPERKGRLFVISAPSGTGKTTLCRLLMDEFKDICYSVSHTTRAPRSGEIDGKDYFFVTRERFEELVRGRQMAEWAEVHGNYYGTSLGFIRDRLQSGFDILLDIDVQGAESIRKAYPGAITVFIRPPSLETLRERLTRRGTDSPDVIETRIGNAVREMDQMNRFDHVIVNDDLEIAKQELFGIVRTGR